VYTPSHHRSIYTPLNDFHHPTTKLVVCFFLPKVKSPFSFRNWICPTSSPPSFPPSSTATKHVLAHLLPLHTPTVDARSEFRPLSYHHHRYCFQPQLRTKEKKTLRNADRLGSARNATFCSLIHSFILRARVNVALNRTKKIANTITGVKARVLSLPNYLSCLASPQYTHTFDPSLVGLACAYVPTLPLSHSIFFSVLCRILRAGR
jgi:hypothetical protein